MASINGVGLRNIKYDMADLQEIFGHPVSCASVYLNHNKMGKMYIEKDDIGTPNYSFELDYDKFKKPYCMWKSTLLNDLLPGMYTFEWFMREVEGLCSAEHKIKEILKTKKYAVLVFLGVEGVYKYDGFNTKDEAISYERAVRESAIKSLKYRYEKSNINNIYSYLIKNTDDVSKKLEIEIGNKAQTEEWMARGWEGSGSPEDYAGGRYKGHLDRDDVSVF